jgi:hypothetical protein
MAPETMTVNDALWRIAELASRSSDPKWRGDRTQAMHDLEAAIHEVGTALNDCAAGLEGAQAAAEEAGAQARAARGEWDRERARAAHWEAKATEALEALAAHQTHAETAEADRDDDLRALRRAHQELSIARAALAGVEAERDEARSALTTAQTALAAARTAQATARVETEEAEARRLAAEKARRLAESERDAAVGVLERRPPVADIEIDVRTPREVTHSEATVADLQGDESSEPVSAPAKPRLLHVAATLGHLLPDDMGALLVPGARVVRREGRLAVLLAIAGSAGSPWAESISRLEEEQADLLRAQGFRVEWSQGDRLAS